MKAPVLVIGAGIMGAGIAQVAAQTGHPVRLFDLREGAAAAARDRLADTLAGLAAKGRLDAAAARAAAERIEAVATLQDARDAGVAIEAIVENLDAKRALFRELETVLAPDALLCSNTSSISITAIANGLQNPARLAGMHFFNPVPLMRLVEVVSGLQTDPAVAQAVFDLAQAWGKTAVHAKSTPGFIVNRIARPYYAETLALLQEQAAPPQVLDACLEAAGFRMGPCALMDLIGHDTNFAVTQSVYEANFYDKRYVPSGVQREMVAGGLLGRKSGRGFYRYPEGPPALAGTAPVHAPAPLPAALVVHGDDAIADDLARRAAAALGRAPERARGSGWTGLALAGARLQLTDGRTATELAAATGAAETAVVDRYDPQLPAFAERPVLAFAVGGAAGEPGAEPAAGTWPAALPGWLAALGFVPVRLPDVPGLVVARTLAMLVNEAADAVNQGVCSTDGADAAMKLGVNYPRGPFEWLAGWAPAPAQAAAQVVQVLDALDRHHRGERYRASPWLRRRAGGATLPG